MTWFQVYVATYGAIFAFGFALHMWRGRTFDIWKWFAAALVVAMPISFPVYYLDRAVASADGCGPGSGS